MNKTTIAGWLIGFIVGLSMGFVIASYKPIEPWVFTLVTSSMLSIILFVVWLNTNE
jgi:ABC-type nitrate/sulfonate/bicarbonate transport system permease component